MDKTLLKGLMLIETIYKLDGKNLTIDELTEMVGLSRSNTHRTLQTLIHAGYVRRDPILNSYICTLKMFEMGAQLVTRMDVRRYAPSFMRKLAQHTKETVHLSVLDGLDVVYIDKIDSPQPLIAYSTVGGRAPAYAVATGKALLAFQEPEYLDQFDFEKSQYPNTQRQLSLPAIKQEMADIMRLGYAINRGEWRDSIGGVAAPIFNGLGEPVAALGISGPLERLTLQKKKEYTPFVLKNAQQLKGYQRQRKRDLQDTR